MRIAQSIPSHLMLGALLVLAAAIQGTATAHASSCAAEIAQLEQTADGAATYPALGPTAPQSIAAQRGRQPTPASVKRAEEEARFRFDAVVARAKAFDAAGKAPECMQAVADAKKMFQW